MKLKSQEWQKTLVYLSKSLNLQITQKQSIQMSSYASEIIDSNKKINITAITDSKEVIEKHIIDSLIPARFITACASVLDLGTGGGFPGIPLKIYSPSLFVCLVDSSRKKINFLKYVIRTLNLKNIYAHQYRVEELSNHPDFAGEFDVVISRAFTSLKKFLTLSAPLITKEGCIIAMKGKEVQKEIDELAIAEVGDNIYIINDIKFELQIEKYRLPVSGDERSLVIARNHFS